jgi:inorganic pyrophosphatase
MSDAPVASPDSPLFAKHVKTKDEGVLETMDYRMFAHKATDAGPQKAISMWHDVHLYPESNVVNMVCEIPKTTRKKYEIATMEGTNPIKQDIKDGKLREFLKGDIYFNYGCIPQTWEDPNEIDTEAGHPGDNDPLDVCEIGLRILKVGEIVPVKLLGVLCLIDEGETDWKLICISTADPWAAILHDVADVERLLPGTLGSIREWFR